MLAIFVIFLAASVTLSETLPMNNPQTRLVGSKPVDILDHPYQVSLMLNGNHICGGTIVSSHFVLTAAHCTSRNDVNALSIRAGSNNRNKGGTVIFVKAIIEHNDYDHTNLDYDIAVMELISPLPLSPGSGIDYIDLPKSLANVTDGTVCSVTGWGTMVEGSNLIPAMLQGLSIPTLAQKVCKDTYGSMFTDRMICAGFNSGGMNICYGDGGSPLSVNGVLVGISSWSYGCARPNYPGLYLKVSLVREWIYNIIGL